MYSTDPNFQFEPEDQLGVDTLLPAQQKLLIKLETKHRGGKAVTLVTGFKGKEEDLQTLGKSLKNWCGTGGSAKDAAVIIQGDQRDKVLQWLLNNGYKGSRKL